MREAYGTGYALLAYPNLLGKKGYVVVVVVVVVVVCSVVILAISSH